MSLTFLNSLFLAAIAAAAIPIIIHLLQRRRLKRIEFSDLRFLAPLNQQRMRSLNLRRWLLLLLRVLIVALTALAMARPSLRGSLTSLVPTQAHSSVLVMLDTSYSMRAEGEQGTALDMAKTVVTELLAQLQPGDEVSLMAFDTQPRRLLQTPVHDFDVVRQRLEALEPTFAGTDWTRAIAEGLEVLSGALEPNRELYVVSDFAGANTDSLRVDLRAKQRDIRVTFVPVRVEPFVNVSIEGVQVPPGAVLRDDPVRIGVTVRNHAKDVPADCVLQLEIGGEAKGAASPRLGRGAVQTQEFTVVATQAREQEGVVRKRADRLPVDDTYRFVLPVLGDLSVLHVMGADNAGGSFFVSRALEPSRAGRSPLSLAEVSAARFASPDLEGKQVIVVSSNAVLSPSQTQILARFVSDGAGLCLFSGWREAADAQNHVLEELGDARVRGVAARQDGFINLADLRPSGILAGFKPEELKALEQVQFRRNAELTPGTNARTVLRFTGGGAALVEGSHAAGKYMLYGFDAGAEGSDLALSPMFLPLLHRTVVYLAGETGRQKLLYNVGERIEVQMPIGNARRADRWRDDQDEPRFARAGVSDGGAVAAIDDERLFTVTTPSGRTEAVPARYVGKTALVAYEDTAEPGHYVFEGAGHRLVRAVNVDSRESDLRPFEPGDLARALQLDVDELGSAASLGEHIQSARHGKELYKFVVALVILAMLVELMISRVAPEQPRGST